MLWIWTIFALFRAFNSSMEALGWKRSRIRTAIVELSWQDLFAVWLAQSFPKIIHQEILDQISDEGLPPASSK